MLQVKNISKSFGLHHVLKDVSFELNEGDYCVLMGKNGEGKTTLLKIIACLCQPDKGEICFENCDVRDSASLYRKQIGFYISSCFFCIKS